MGLCTECGQPVEASRQGKILCVACEAKRSQTASRSYHYYQRIGICPICKTAKLKPGQARCNTCREYLNRLSRETRSQESRDYDNQVHKDRAQYRKDNGLCIYCGEPLGNDTHAACLKCRLHRRKLRHDRQERLRHQSRCTCCGAKIYDQHTLCPECRKSRARIAYGR